MSLKSVLQSGIIQENKTTTSAKEILLLIGSELNDLTRSQISLLEADLANHQLSTLELTTLRSWCIKKLQLPPSAELDWKSATNWFHDDYNCVLRIVRTLTQNEPIDSYLEELSIHSNPNVPWGSRANSDLVSEITSGKTMNWPMYIDGSVKPRLLVLPSVAKKLHGGLRPRLGYGGAKKEILEEDSRRNWKQSSKVAVLSMIWFLIDNINQGDWFEQDWGIITSFLLNLGGDYDPLFKFQNCLILRHFLQSLESTSKNQLLSRTGLIDMFIEMARGCLVHIPPLTPASDSQLLLSVGYPCTVQLLEIKARDLDKAETKTQYTELVNSNILSSISYLVNDKGNHEIIKLLIGELDKLIAKNSSTLLISMSRISFTLNQVITNPNILDEDIEVVIQALECQHTILTSFTNYSHLLMDYKYDLLGVWVIMIKRISRFPEFTKYSLISLQIKKNCQLFKKLVVEAGAVLEYNMILQKVNETTELQTVLEENGVSLLLEGI